MSFYQITNKRKECINRDKNSFLNILNIVEQYLFNKTIPLHLSRKKK
jgi:hypothetical protein